MLEDHFLADATLSWRLIAGAKYASRSYSGDALFTPCPRARAQEQRFARLVKSCWPTSSTNIRLGCREATAAFQQLGGVEVVARPDELRDQFVQLGLAQLEPVGAVRERRLVHLDVPAQFVEHSSQRRHDVIAMPAPGDAEGRLRPAR